MAVTMSDVAKRAQVSLKTVSRVVNNQGEVSDATRLKVMAVIEEMGYRAALPAQMAATQRTNTVGMVIGDITNPFFGEMARGVQEVARTAGYKVFMANGDNDFESELQLRALMERGVDGSIIFPSAEMEASIGKLASRDHPIISVNYAMTHKHVGVVKTDMYVGMRAAMDHLAAKGHTHIGMLTGNNQNTMSTWDPRLKGYWDGLAAHNLPQNELYIRKTALGTFKWGLSAASSLLRNQPQITAIVTLNDLLATGIVHACRRMGRRVPEDCAVIGFDDILLASLVTPALTTVRVDKINLGYWIMQQLLTLIRDPDQPVPPIVLDTELIVREST